MLSSENSQVLLSSVSSSRASVVCCENGDVAFLPGARRSSPCRLAHEVRATNLLPSWVSCVCSLLSHLTTFIDGRLLSALSSRLQSRRGPTGVVHPVGRRYSVQVYSDLPCEEHVVHRLVQRRVRVAAVWSWGLSVTR